MRILHISTRLILGGSQENTVLSCEGQARLGHDVHLAFGPIYGPEGSLLERAASFRTEGGRGITCHEVPSMVRRIDPIMDRRCLGELRTLIRDLGPDIVHTHSSKAGILGRLAAWSQMRERVTAEGRSRPSPPGEGDPGGGVVHTIHGPPFHRYQSWIKNAVYIAAERYAANRCHAIISVADAMTRQYLARGIGRPEQYITVYSGMEVEAFVDPRPGESRDEIRRELGLGADDFVIGTVSRLAELKGHDDLLDALGDELKARADWKLLWVGDGWWRSRLTRRIDRMGLSGKVVMTGLVPSQRVPAMMRAMDVLAHPSYREGLPRTVPQALLAGVAPVAYDVDGTGEVCIDGVTGLLLRPGDTSGLRTAIRWMHENADGRRDMIERGRDLCRRRFAAETMVQALEGVYARVLGL